MTTALTWFQCV